MRHMITFISIIMLQILSGSVNMWSAINPFVISFLHTKNPETQYNNGFYFFGIGVLFQNSTGIIGNFIYQKYGYKYSIIPGGIFIILSNFLLYFSTNLIVDFALIALDGLGIGMILIPSCLFIWRLYPDKKGLMSGIVISVFSLSPMVLAIAAQYIINPNSDTPDINTKFYPDNVAEKEPKFFLFVAILFTIIFIISLALLIIDRVENKLVLEEAALISTSDNNNEASISTALKSKQFITIFFMAFLQVFFYFSLSNMAKSFGVSCGFKEEVLFILLLAYYLIGGLTGPIFGKLFDIYGFKFMYCLFTVWEVLATLLLFFFSEILAIFVIVLVGSSIFLGGSLTILPAYMSKIFGDKNGGVCYCIVIMSFGISTIISAMISKSIENHQGFLNAFLIFGGLALISLIMCIIFVDNVPVDYSRDDNNSLIKEENTLTTFVDHSNQLKI